MDFEFSDEAKAFVEEVEKFLDEHATADVADVCRENMAQIVDTPERRGFMKKLSAKGVKDMVRISDARMSGTAYGTIVLHVAPDSCLDGAIGLVRTGDRISHLHAGAGHHVHGGVGHLPRAHVDALDKAVPGNEVAGLEDLHRHAALAPRRHAERAPGRPTHTRVGRSGAALRNRLGTGGPPRKPANRAPARPRGRRSPGCREALAPGRGPAAGCTRVGGLGLRAAADRLDPLTAPRPNRDAEATEIRKHTGGTPVPRGHGEGESDALAGVLMLLQIHDELVFEAPVETAETARAVIVDRMQHAMELDVPLIVDSGISGNWYEAK